MSHYSHPQPASVSIGVDPMKVSTTSSQTDETNVSQSTVITVRLYGTSSQSDATGAGAIRRTRSEPPTAGDTAHAPTQETLVTDVVVIRHPRSVLILAVLELIIGLQMLVIGTILVIYNGPIYASGLWAGWPFVAQGVVGILTVKKYPIRRLIIVYLAITILCLLIALGLFGVTLYELKLQEQILRDEDYDYGLSTRKMNVIVETTKAGIYIVQMVLLAAHALASMVTIVLCIINVRQPSKELRRAFYIADDQYGHQLVLVPVKLRTGADIDAWLDEAAAAASSAAFGGGGGIRSSYSAYNALANFPYGQYPTFNGSASNTLRSSKAVQTNVTFGQ